MATRAVRVVTEVAALDRQFDYLVTNDSLHVGVGDRVRVNLHGRSVRGWVQDLVEPDPALELKPITKWLGLGPPASELELLAWAAHRWCAPVARFLLAASPNRLVRQLPNVPRVALLEKSVTESAINLSPGAIRMAPTTDPLGLVLHAYQSTREREGSLLVLLPTEAWAHRLAGRLAQRGCPVALAHEWDRMRAGWPVIVGARGVAFAPAPVVAGAVIIDADDESYRSEASPTWHAVDVLRQRCGEFDAPLWVTSPILSPSLRVKFSEQSVAPDEFALWPAITVVDRRRSDPRDGVLSADAVTAAHRALASEEQVAVAVVLQRLGKGRLFACHKCGDLAICPQCALPEIEFDGMISCPTHVEPRELFCRSCGATKLRRIRSGVTTLARDVAAQLGCAVSEITASSGFEVPSERVVVGTEAIWQRVRRAGVVIFVDFDQYLLAPRERARRDAVLAVAKAARLVGAKREGRGRVVLQTRRDDDLVIRSLESVNFEELTAQDDETAQLLGLAPFRAVAELSGDGASEFASAVASPLVNVRPTSVGFMASAESIEVLTNRLAEVPRPAARLRVAVD